MRFLRLLRFRIIMARRIRWAYRTARRSSLDITAGRITFCGNNDGIYCHDWSSWVHITYPWIISTDFMVKVAEGWREIEPAVLEAERKLRRSREQALSTLNAVIDSVDDGEKTRLLRPIEADQ